MQIKSVSVRALFFSSLSTLVLSACATTPYMPVELDSVAFRDRAQAQTEGLVTVTAAVPGPDETRALFDLPLYDDGIQPVWLEVRNGTDSQIRYSPVGTDPEYFSSQEVAYVHRGGFSGEGKVKMNRHFYEMAMPRRIPAGETRSGFVFTHARPGTKAFNVDLFGPSQDNDLSFTFFVNVPGFEPDHSEAYFEELYGTEQIRELTRDELRSEMAGTDYLTWGASGQSGGVPINAVVIGEAQEVLQALIRANWVETPRADDAKSASAAEYFYDRVADVVFRKNQSASGERNELRFWLSPMRVEGTPVWFVQVTNYIGEGKGQGHLDPDLDDAAAFFVQDIWYGQGLARYGWVQGQGSVPYEDPKQAAGASYFTSGYVAVLWLSGPAVSMLDADALDWGMGPARDVR